MAISDEPSDNKMLHTESRVARLFEINAVRRDPVNITVIGLIDVERGSTLHQRDRGWTSLADCRSRLALVRAWNLLSELARG